MARSETPFIELIKEAWPYFLSNLVVTVGAPAILVIVPFVLVGIPTCLVAVVIGCLVGWSNKAMILPSMIPVGLIGIPLFAVAYSAIRVGWTNVMLKVWRGERYSLQDLKSGMPWLLNFTITMFIVGVLTALGSVLLVVPGFFIMVRTAFAPYLVIEEDLGPIEALVRSNELVTGYSWQIFGYHAIYSFANMVLAIIPFIGLILPLASMGFFDLVLTRLYLYRVGEEPVALAES